MEETKDFIPMTPPPDPMKVERQKKNLRRKKTIPVWRQPDYRNNDPIISWEVPGYADGVYITNPEHIMTIPLPKGMTLCEYEHWCETEEGQTYLKARFPECMAVAAKMDKEKEEANAKNSNNDSNE